MTTVLSFREDARPSRVFEEAGEERRHRQLFDVARVDSAEERLRNQVDRLGTETCAEERCHRYVGRRRGPRTADEATREAETRAPGQQVVRQKRAPGQRQSQ